MGGWVPTSSHLIEMFCFIIEGDRQYYDSECVKRAQSTKILAIDASYKVPKWMMKWGSDYINFPLYQLCILVFIALYMHFHDTIVQS